MLLLLLFISIILRGRNVIISQTSDIADRVRVLWYESEIVPGIIDRVVTNKNTKERDHRVYIFAFMYPITLVLQF